MPYITVPIDLTFLLHIYNFVQTNTKNIYCICILTLAFVCFIWIRFFAISWRLSSTSAKREFPLVAEMDQWKITVLLFQAWTMDTKCLEEKFITKFMENLNFKTVIYINCNSRNTYLFYSTIMEYYSPGLFLCMHFWNSVAYFFFWIFFYSITFNRTSTNNVTQNTNRSVS